MSGKDGQMTDNPMPHSELTARVQQALEELRPYLQNDGGDVELVAVEDGGVVQVRFHGACAGCPHAQMTLSNGIQRSLQQKISEVTEVRLVP